MIRQACGDDYPVFAPMIREMVLSCPAGILGYDEGTVRSLFEGNPLADMLVDPGRGFVGYAISNSMFNRDKLVGIIFLWGVLPEFRGIGVGTSLLREAEIASRGVSAMVIMANPGPPADIAICSGFQPYKLGLIKEV